MRILQLCKKFPYPLKDGESIAVTHLSKALNDLGCDVTLLSMNTTKHYCDVTKLPKTFNHYKEIHAVRVNNNTNYLTAFLNIFSKESYHITRFVSKQFEEKLIEILKENTFDVVQIETPILSFYIPIIRKYSKALVAMRSHNVEYEIWDRYAENQTFAPLRWYWKSVAEKLQRFEQKYLNQYDLVLALTGRDLKLLKKEGLKKPNYVIPIGLDVRNYKPDFSCYKKPPTIGFIGSLDWMPNQEGLKWFVENVWGQIIDLYPNVELHVAGRHTPKWVKNMNQQGVVIHGEVPNAKDFINQHSIMIVPLFSGSGMRVKILEGMALGRVVVTTELGLEGIDAKDYDEVLLSNSEEGFLYNISNCLKNPKTLPAIGHSAQELAAQKYDNLQIGKQLVAIYREHLKVGSEKLAVR